MQLHPRSHCLPFPMLLGRNFPCPSTYGHRIYVLTSPARSFPFSPTQGHHSSRFFLSLLHHQKFLALVDRSQQHKHMLFHPLKKNNNKGCRLHSPFRSLLYFPPFADTAVYTRLTPPRPSPLDFIPEGPGRCPTTETPPPAQLSTCGVTPSAGFSHPTLQHYAIPFSVPPSEYLTSTAPHSPRFPPYTVDLSSSSSFAGSSSSSRLFNLGVWSSLLVTRHSLFKRSPSI